MTRDCDEPLLPFSPLTVPARLMGTDLKSVPIRRWDRRYPWDRGAPGGILGCCAPRDMVYAGVVFVGAGFKPAQARAVSAK